MKKNILLLILILFCLSFFSVCTASATKDKSEWLSGSGYYKKQLEIANKHSEINIPNHLIIEGKKIISQTHKKYKINPYYSTPHIFGFKMVVWLPAEAWNKMDSKQQEAIENYMASKYKNWGIGIGQVSGEDILSDEIIASH